MSYDILFRQALQLHDAGELGKAEQLYRQILEAAPQNPDVLNLMGLIAQAKGLHNQAVNWFHQAIKQAPHAALFYFNLGLSLYNENKPYEAVEAYKKAIENMPDLKEAYNNLGEVWQSLNEKERALQNYQKAIELDGAYLLPQANLAFLQEDTASLEKLHNKYPAEPSISYFLSRLYRRQNRGENALALLRQTDSQTPGIYDIVLGLAELLSEESPAEAKCYFEQALCLNPNSVTALVNLGCFAAKEENFQLSEKYFKQALDLDAHSLEAHANYANMLYQAGRRQEALEEYRAAVIINPELPEISNNLGLVLKDMKEYEEALGLFFNAFVRSPQTEAYTVNIAETLTMLYYQNAETAKKIAENWLKLAPDNAFAQRLNAAFKGELSEDTQIYIQKLFDNFADNYELVLANIGYNVPRRFREIAGNVKGTLVDLGCGSGLVGLAFKTVFSNIIGVDISSKLLEKAAEKECYQELIHEDIISFCQNRLSSYKPDLITAADVFCYFADIEKIISLCTPFPLLFSIETSPTDTTTALPSGRFQHNPRQVLSFLQKHYQQVEQYPEILRKENGEDVHGVIFLASRPLLPQ